MLKAQRQEFWWSALYACCMTRRGYVLGQAEGLDERLITQMMKMAAPDLQREKRTASRH
ncbi:TPA: hypothetical protein ACKRWH_003240 [Providencia rettgeri]|uniref:hypothetical protein n=1 Tax=Providencia rettgeri TaxID=587 RepID=UPI0032EEE21A